MACAVCLLKVYFKDWYLGSCGLKVQRLLTTRRAFFYFFSCMNALSLCRDTASPGKPWTETFELSKCALHSSWTRACMNGFLLALAQQAVQAGQWTQTLLIFLCYWTPILMYLQMVVYACRSERKVRVFLKRKKAKLDFLDVPSEERGRLEDCCKQPDEKAVQTSPRQTLSLAS